MPRYGKKMFRRPKKNYKKGITATKVKKIVNRAIAKKAELKAIEHSAASQSIHDTNPVAINTFCECAQGDTSITRDGSSINVRNVSTVITLRVGSALAEGDFVRLIWIWINDDTMDAGLITDFDAVTYNGYLPRFQDQKYRILSDKTYHMGTNTTLGYEKIIKQNFKLNKRVTYASSASSVERGELILYAYSKNNTSPNGSTTITMNSRTYYYDM